MQLISKFRKWLWFLLRVSSIYSKYAWFIPLTDKKGIIIINALQQTLDESKRKPNKIWVEKGNEFYNRSMKSFLQSNDLEMYSTHNEEKFVIAERFIRTLENKIYKYLTSISKNVYIDKLDDIVNKYNNTDHSKIKMKPIDVKSNTYIDSTKDINKKDLEFKIGDIARILRYKYIFAKGYSPNLSFYIFMNRKSKSTVPWIYVINDLNGEEIVGPFYEKRFQKTSQGDFRI